MRVLRWHVTIASSTERVWAKVTDFANMHRWFLGVRRVTLHAAAAHEGARRTLTLLGGISHLERVGRWDPGARTFSIEVLEPPRIARDWVGTIAVDGTDGAAELFWELRYVPRFGLAGRIVDALFVAPVLNLAFTLSLRRFADQVQRAARERSQPRVGRSGMLGWRSVSRRHG